MQLRLAEFFLGLIIHLLMYVGHSAVPIYRYSNISLHKQARYDIDSKLRISIYRDTGSKVDYFTCIFNELVARAFFCALLEVVRH